MCSLTPASAAASGLQATGVFSTTDAGNASLAYTIGPTAAHPSGSTGTVQWESVQL